MEKLLLEFLNYLGISNKNMKKINKVICSALLVCMVVAFIPIKTHAAVASGKKSMLLLGDITILIGQA